MDVWGLEASLVDVVEGEGLRGVGAVLVHLHRRPGAALAAGRGLRLLTSGRHDFGQSEGHGGREELLRLDNSWWKRSRSEDGVQTDSNSE